MLVIRQRKRKSSSWKRRIDEVAPNKNYPSDTLLLFTNGIQRHYAHVPCFMFHVSCSINNVTTRSPEALQPHIIKPVYYIILRCAAGVYCMLYQHYVSYYVVCTIARSQIYINYYNSIIVLAHLTIKSKPVGDPCYCNNNDDDTL